MVFAAEGERAGIILTCILAAVCVNDKFLTALDSMETMKLQPTVLAIKRFQRQHSEQFDN
jgi:hypothetical protein